VGSPAEGYSIVADARPGTPFGWHSALLISRTRTNLRWSK